MVATAAATAGVMPGGLEIPPGGEAPEARAPHGNLWWMAAWFFHNPFGGAIASMAYTPDGGALILSSAAGELARLELDTGRTSWFVKADKNGGNAFVMDVSPDSSSFLVCPVIPRLDGKRDLEVRSAADGGLLKRVSRDSTYYHDCGPGDSAGSTDHRKTGENIARWKGSGVAIWTMIAENARYTPDGKNFLVRWTADRDDGARYDTCYSLYDSAGFRELWWWQAVGGSGHRSSRSAKFAGSNPGAVLSMAPADGSIIYATSDGEVRGLSGGQVRAGMEIENVHDKEPGRAIFTATPGAGQVPVCLDFNRDGSGALITYSGGGMEHLELIDTRAGKRLFKTERVPGIGTAFFSPDDSCIIGGGGGILVWDGAGNITGAWPLAGQAGTVYAVNPVKREIAIGTYGVYLLSERQPVIIRTVPGVFTATGLFIRYGMDMYVASTGGSLRWKSGGWESDTVCGEKIFACVSCPGGVPIREGYDERFGEISIASRSVGEITLWGGLPEDQYRSIPLYRKNILPWNTGESPSAGRKQRGTGSSPGGHGTPRN